MNKNYLDALRIRLTARYGAAKAEILLKEIDGLITKHHILPDNVLQKTELGKRAITIGYYLDADSNLIGLVRKGADQSRLRQLGEATAKQPGHWTSHPQYDRAITARLNETQRKLERQYGKPLTQIPDDVILKEMKNLENEFRLKIRNGAVPQKDNRLAFMPFFPGRGEVRV